MRKVGVSGNVLILAGGGGHTGYAYALAQALRTKTTLSFIVPQDDNLSYRKLIRFGHVEVLVKARGPKTPTREFAARLIKAFAGSLGKVTRRFDVVVSTGSNFCVPPALIAWMKGIPVVNIESSVRFSKASRTAVILKPMSKLTVLQWEEQKRILDGLVVGPILQKPEVKPWKGKYILVTGGTYGHKLLFDALKESSLTDVVLQTGTIDPEPYRKAHPEWRVITLTDRFHELLAGADVVVTHFGSTALEAVIYGKPTVIVLNPEWTRTVGLYDAQLFARKVNAIMLSSIDSESLVQAIDKAKKQGAQVLPDGSENLARIISHMLEK